MVFLQNLKVTIKIVGTIWLMLSLTILFDCYIEDDFSDAVDVIYFLAFAPLVAVQTYIYTCLKESQLNKLVCSIIFSLIGVLLLWMFLLVASFLEQEDISLRFIIVMGSLIFVCLVATYYQLPWEKDDV
ncbi:MAG: hypothetical protein ABJJ44_16345 [Paraglaciecola sp.]|uniref:hypothetical protein n=1 Tax=Paraglaciecola sp. TaxID=1920173 RepID=UPI0032985EEE